MKKLLVLFIVLISIQIYSQKTKIKILNQIGNEPIENVLVYSDSILIDKTNKEGFFHINSKKVNRISLIKEDFYDTIINIEDIHKNVYLRKINAIILKEVIVTDLKVETVLDSLLTNMKLQNVLISENLHFFNCFTTNNDTLIYFNKRLKHKNRDGYYCANDNHIVNNFKTTNENRAIYFLNNNEIIFNNDYRHINPPSLSFEYQIVVKFRKGFEYSIAKSDGFYKISFNNKKNNKEYPYTGYMIVNIEDFGLYEFSCKAAKDDKNKRNLIFKDKIINFKILNEESFTKYSKNINGKYELVTYRFDSQLQILDGYFKGSVFTNKCRKEPTLLFDFSNTKKIDLLTYKFIQ